MADLTDSDIETLRAKHGRIVHVRYNGYDLVFRKPTSSEAQMYRTSPMDTGEDRHQAMASLAQFIVVHPSPAELNELFDEYPFMLSNENVQDAISKAMGVREEKKDSTPRARPNASTPNASPSASPTGLPSSQGVS